MSNEDDMQISQEILSWYESSSEKDRLLSPNGQLEFERTLELIKRYLPSVPGVILDVGGGAGIYSFVLAEWGYQVHLIDAVPLHIQQAKDAAERMQGCIPASFTVGDARHLEFPDESVDVVLLLGPLYHLTDRSDRLDALREAYRVLKSGGIVCAAVISRFASMRDGLYSGYLHDSEFVEIVRQDLKSGQHRNPNNHPAYFTTSFFHHPDELRAEVEEAGFEIENLFAIEGPAWLIPDIKSFWQEEKDRKMLLDLIRATETERSLLGASAHIMAIARKGKLDL